MRVGPGSPARRGEGRRGHAGHTWGAISPRLPGLAGWARAGESLVLVKAGRDHGAGPAGGAWAGARRGGRPAPRGLQPQPRRLANGTGENMAAGGPLAACGAVRG